MSTATRPGLAGDLSPRDVAGDPTPVHKRPTSCHVCGRPPLNGQARPACAHDYTNAEAFAEAATHDARVVTYDPAAKYVDDTRGR